MTSVKVKRLGGSIVQVESVGHTGYAEFGKDIVCSGLSSIMQTAVLGLMNVVGVKVDIVRNDENGYYKATISQDLDKATRHDCDMILETMLLGIKDYSEGLSKFVKLEVK